MPAYLRAAAIFLLGAVLFTACKKHEDEARVLSTRDKMLGTWRRSMRAYDINGNHLIDAAEVDHSPAAQATDTIILTLAPDATYIRSQIFKGTSYPQSGTWHLQSSDAQLVIAPTTSTTPVDTFRLDSVAQEYFLQHTPKVGGPDYYESFVRP